MKAKERKEKKDKNSSPSFAEAIVLDPGVPDSISDSLLFSGAGPFALAANGVATTLALTSSLAKRFEPTFLKNIPVVDKAFHNMRTTLHCDTSINVLAAAASAASGQWLIAATGLAGAYSNIPELTGIRHSDDEDYMQNASMMKLALKRKDFWLGLNYAFAVLLVGGASTLSLATMPFLALATIVGLKNAKNHLPERTNHPKIIVAAAFLAAGIPALFTGVGGIVMGLSTMIAAVSFIANEVHVTPGGLKQVVKDCLTLDNYKYGFIPFVKSGFGLKKVFENPALIGIVAKNTSVKFVQAAKNTPIHARNGIDVTKGAAKNIGKKSNIVARRRAKRRDAEIAVNESENVGRLTEDGIYIGRTKDADGVERDYYAAPEDATDGSGKRLSLNFNEAAEYARNAKILGHSDWMVPTSVSNKYDPVNTPDILSAMFNSRSKGAFEGTFEEAGWYWSSTTKPITEEDQNSATIQHFRGRGRHSYGYKKEKLRVRLVRSVEVN